MSYCTIFNWTKKEIEKISRISRKSAYSFFQDWNFIKYRQSNSDKVKISKNYWVGNKVLQLFITDISFLFNSLELHHFYQWFINEGAVAEVYIRDRYITIWRQEQIKSMQHNHNINKATTTSTTSHHITSLSYNQNSKNKVLHFIPDKISQASLTSSVCLGIAALWNDDG